jgi:membrane protein implicated in regulation of membrane protease activity
MGDTDVWRWIWILVIAGFLIGEMFTPGTFFFLPFAAGALAAAIAAFAGGSIGLQWILFVGIAALTSFAFIPLRRRLDRIQPPVGVGSQRVLHQDGTITTDISPGPTGAGSVRIGREEWRAESLDHESIPAGTSVRVVEVRGTGVVVKRVMSNEGDHP